jgi:hypothetical protein
MLLMVMKIMQMCSIFLIKKRKPLTGLSGIEEDGVLFDDDRVLFNDGYQLLEGVRLVHGQIGQDLTVKPNALLAELMDEGGIGQTFCTDGGIDTRDPQRTVFPFLQFATDITVLQALFQDVFSDGIDILSFAVESFRLFQDAFPACPAGDGVY